MGEKFNHFFVTVLDRHAPIRFTKYKNKKSPEPSEELKKLRRQRDNAQSKGNKAKLRILRQKCNALSRREEMKSVRARIENRKGEEWKIVREIIGKKGSSSKVEMKDEKGDILTTREAAEEFNKFFIEKIEKIRAGIEEYKGDYLQGAKAKAELLQVSKGAFELHMVTEREVEKAIKKSKGSNCPDIFGIAPAALKLAPEVVKVPLTWIINCIIQEGSIPRCWKIARVLPLHKKNDKDKPSNYRPVSILSSASKIMEEVIRLQFSRYFEERKILPSSQFGFRRGLSTVHAAGAAEHDWIKAKQNGLKVGALFFDLSAAFDTLDVNLLREKLLVYGAGQTVVRWVSAYLRGRQQLVEYQGEKSGITEVMVGSPQGSVISPLLFLIMVADLEDWVTEGTTLSYADDTTVYAAAKTKEEVRRILEKSAKEVLAFMQSAKLSANPSKTKFIMFGRSSEPAIRVGDVQIDESPEEVLLGLTFSKALTWKNHMDHLEAELRRRIGILRRLSWHLPKDIVCQMIQAIFTSKMIYALPLVTDFRQEDDLSLRHLHKLHRAAMKAALSVYGKRSISDEELYGRSGQKSVWQMAKESTCNFACNCMKGKWNNHPLLKNRVEHHFSMKETRQTTSCAFPPQSTKRSMVTKTLEMWEKLPATLQSESDHLKRKILIKEHLSQV